MPGLSARLVKGSGSDPLVTLRQVFISFVGGIALFQIVLLFLTPEDGRSNAFAIGLLVVGALNVFVVRRLFEKPLRCEEQSLLAQYQTRFFVRVAFCESAALFGFVGFFVANVRWVYPLGALMAYAGFFSAAPSRRNLARDQAVLRRSGCDKSLVRALRGLE